MINPDTITRGDRVTEKDTGRRWEVVYVSINDSEYCQFFDLEWNDDRRTVRRTALTRWYEN